MAKAPAKAAKSAVAVPNLFGAAVAKKAASPKKPVGTTLAIPQQVDSEGKLVEELAILHTSITDIIAAKAEEDAAKNRSNIGKTNLKEFVENAWADRAVKSGGLPTTPILVVNAKGESLTYVVQDKTTSSGLNEEQVAMLGDLLGPGKLDEITVSVTEFAFDPNVMQEIAGDVPVGLDMVEAAGMAKVADVVARRVGEAMAAAVAAGEISEEQMNGLIAAKVKTVLRPGELAKMPQTCGADVTRLKSVISVLQPAVTRYLKT